MIPALLLALGLATAPPSLTADETLLVAASAGIGAGSGAFVGAAALFVDETAPWTPLTTLGGVAVGALVGGAVGALLVDRARDAPFAALGAVVGVPAGLLASLVLIYPVAFLVTGFVAIVVSAALAIDPADWTPEGAAIVGTVGVALTAVVAASAAGGALAGLELVQQVRHTLAAEAVPPNAVPGSTAAPVDPASPVDPTTPETPPARGNSVAPPPSPPPPPGIDDDDAIDL